MTSAAHGTEAASKARFDFVRYAQAWEDADVLLAALEVGPRTRCLSIASAGDNVFALLAHGPERVIAVDLGLAQLACLDLRAAAYRTLDHAEFLELLGVRPSRRRAELYARCLPVLDSAARAYWDARPRLVARGVATIGKFERYFTIFRRAVLPLIHDRRTVEAALAPRSPEERRRFYDRIWNTPRWRALGRIFASRAVVGRLGRDPSFFDYADEPLGDRMLAGFRHALVDLDPSENPYLQWILTGTYRTALPFALRPERFGAIRAHLDRLERHHVSLETYLARPGVAPLHAFNLSDVFEYMAEPAQLALLRAIVAASPPGARLAYWNMLVPRTRPAALADRLAPRPDIAGPLHARDKAFFYRAFVVEERIGAES